MTILRVLCSPLLMVVIITCISACITDPTLPPTPYPTSTLYPTSTPYPTPTGQPADEAFAQAIYERIGINEQMPAVGQETVIWIFYKRPTFAFPDNRGLVVQFTIPRYPTPLEAKLAAYQLVEAAVSVAAEQSIAVGGIEVVYFHEEEPWVALASTPPWGDDQLFLVPIAKAMIKQLEEGGIITPVPTVQETY
jgi:hypothetical protein